MELSEIREKLKEMYGGKCFTYFLTKYYML
jgi:hypothetical protein